MELGLKFIVFTCGSRSRNGRRGGGGGGGGGGDIFQIILWTTISWVREIFRSSLNLFAATVQFLWVREIISRDVKLRLRSLLQ